MSERNLFIKLTYLLYTIVALHALALYFSWYWSIWWYDIVVHFLGGFWVGGLALWFCFFRKSSNTTLGNLKVYIISILAVIVIGVLWELFEFSLDTFVVFQTNNVLDTISDLAADVAGALTASILIMNKKYIKNE